MKPGPRNVYHPKQQPQCSILLTPLSKQILNAAAVRVDQSRAEVVEHLLRLYGGGIVRDEFAPVEEVEAR